MVEGTNATPVKGEADVRASYAALAALVEREGSREGWHEKGRDGWTWSEILFHAAAVGDEVVERFRFALRGGVDPNRRRDPMAVRLRRELIFRTWKWPGPSGFVGMGGPAVQAEPEVVRKRLLKHAADFIETLRRTPPAILDAVTVEHEDLGGLTGPQWARLLRIHARYLELRS